MFCLKNDLPLGKFGVLRDGCMWYIYLKWETSRTWEKEIEGRERIAVHAGKRGSWVLIPSCAAEYDELHELGIRGESFETRVNAHSCELDLDLA